jgi:hypothetical protein
MSTVGGHVENEVTAGGNLFVGDVRSSKGFPVEGDVVDILVFWGVIAGGDAESAATLDTNGSIVNERAPEIVRTAGRGHLIKAESGKHVPRGHLADILVTGKSVGAVAIKRSEDLPDAFGRLPGLADNGVEIRNMVPGFIPVGILSDEAGDIRGGIVAHVTGDDKKGVEFSDKSFASTEESDEAGNIMGYEPRVLPGVALGIIVGPVGGIKGIERFPKMPVGGEAAHESGRGVEILGIDARAFEKVVVREGIAEAKGGEGEGMVGEGVLKGSGDRLVIKVVGDIAVAEEEPDAAFVADGGSPHRYEGEARVKSSVSLENGVGDDGNGRITDHTIGLAAHEVPNG